MWPHHILWDCFCTGSTCKKWERTKEGERRFCADSLLASSAPTRSSRCFQVRFHWFLWFSHCRCWNHEKKTPSRSGGVINCENRAPTLVGADQIKKWLPCSMGVPKSIFATPLVRERRCRKTSTCLCCKLLWFRGGKHSWNAATNKILHFCF